MEETVSVLIIVILGSHPMELLIENAKDATLAV